MRKLFAFTVGFCFLMGGVSDRIIGAPTTKPADSPSFDVNLTVPEGTRLKDMVPRMTLDISPAKNVAIVAVEVVPSATNSRYAPSVMMADLKTGKLTPVADLVAKDQQGIVASVQLSPDRKILLVNWMNKKDSVVYAIALPGGKPVKLAEGRAMAVWAGNQVAVSTIAGEGKPKLGKISIVDPATGKAKELPVRCMVMAGLPDGTLLVGGNPKDAAAEIPIEEAMSKGRLFHVGSDGKVLDDVAPIGIVSSPPVVSEKGKFDTVATLHGTL